MDWNDYGRRGKAQTDLSDYWRKPARGECRVALNGGCKLSAPSPRASGPGRWVGVWDAGVCEGPPWGLERVVPRPLRAPWPLGSDLVLNLSSVPRLCVTLGRSLISPQFHISKTGTITCTSEGCGKDQIGHKWKRPVVSGTYDTFSQCKFIILISLTGLCNIHHWISVSSSVKNRIHQSCLAHSWWSVKVLFMTFSDFLFWNNFRLKFAKILERSPSLYSRLPLILTLYVIIVHWWIQEIYTGKRQCHSLKFRPPWIPPNALSHPGFHTRIPHSV